MQSDTSKNIIIKKSSSTPNIELWIIFLPPTLAVQVIEMVPAHCVCVCIEAQSFCMCVFVSRTKELKRMTWEVHGHCTFVSQSITTKGPFGKRVVH